MMLGKKVFIYLFVYYTYTIFIYLFIIIILILIHSFIHSFRWDDWNEELREDADCLFCTAVLRSPSLAFEHAKNVHGFDFYGLKASLSTYMYANPIIMDRISDCILTSKNSTSMVV